MNKSAVIKQVGEQWYLYTKDGKRVLGKHPTAKAAYAQEYAIQKSQESKMSKQAFIKNAAAIGIQ